MTMEKYSQDDDMLLKQLQDEEHQLMQKVSAIMSMSDKTASEEESLSSTENRITLVRNKIYDLMHQKK